MKIFLINFIGLIQPSGATPPPPKFSDKVGDQPEIELPIDGPLWLLLLLGIILGIYFIYRYRKTTDTVA